MQRIQGRGVSPGRALGRARLVRSFADLLLACPPERYQPFWAGDSTDDTDTDLVCVALGPHSIQADDIPSSFVAVLSEEPWPEAALIPTPVYRPCVDCLGPRLRLIRNGDLLLVDGASGTVFVDPTDRVVAAYQAHSLGIAPGRRIFLEYAHQPVRLPDGREVRVSAAVASAEQAGDALSCGPDAFLMDVGFDADLILATIQAAHGKPVSFCVHPEGCCESALIQAGALGDVTALLSPGTSAASVSGFRSVLDAVVYEALEAGEDPGRVRCGLRMMEDTSPPELVLEPGIERVAAIVRGEINKSVWLDELLDAARSVVVPVELELAAGLRRLADHVLDLGINGVIVAPSEVQLWKEALRACFAFA